MRRLAVAMLVAFMAIISFGCEENPVAPTSTIPPVDDGGDATGAVFSGDFFWQPPDDINLVEDPGTGNVPVLILQGTTPDCPAKELYPMTKLGNGWIHKLDKPLEPCSYYANIGWDQLPGTQEAAWDITANAWNEENVSTSRAIMLKGNTHPCLGGCSGDDPLYWSHRGMFVFFGDGDTELWTFRVVDGPGAPS